MWTYFEYIGSNHQSKCLVQDSKGKECGCIMSGKNPSNLKKHIQSNHPETYKEVQSSDSARVDRKRKASTDDDRSVVKASQSEFQTLSACLSRKVVYWELTSSENVRRQDALVDVFVDTGYPVAMVNNEKFRAFCSVMDNKYQVGCCLCVTSIQILRF